MMSRASCERGPRCAIAGLVWAMVLSACVAKKQHLDQREPITNQPAAGAGAAAAKPNANPACFRIVDGSPTTDSPSIGYPSVYLVAFKISGDDVSGYSLSFCTGTFVSDNVLVTASHCLPPVGKQLLLFGNSANVPVTIDRLNAAPAALAVYAGNDSQRGDTTPSPPVTSPQQNNDVALAVFPDGTATSWSPLARTTRLASTPVTLVGYGNHKSVTDGSVPDHIKFYGSNTLYDIQTAAGPWPLFYDPYLYFLRGTPGPTSPVAMSAHGDSGGPIFDGATMIGTVISGYSDTSTASTVNGPISAGIGATALSIYFNVASPIVTTLANQMVGSGTSHPRVTYEPVAVVANTGGTGGVATAASTPAASTPAAPTPAAPTPASGISSAVVPTSPAGTLTTGGGTAAGPATAGATNGTAAAGCL